MGFRISHCIIVVVSLSLVCFALSNQFTVKQKNKLPSVSALKERCGECYADIVRMIPAIMHTVADVQTAAFDTLQRYCEGDSSCFGKNMSKEQLVKYNKLLNSMADSCQNFTTEITTLLKQIDELKNV